MDDTQHALRCVDPAVPDILPPSSPLQLEERTLAAFAVQHPMESAFLTHTEGREPALRKGIQSSPPELLARVFHFLVATSQCNRDIINATHVCRFFRAVALDHAKLWANIRVNNFPQMQAFVARSKTHLLDVTVVPSRSGQPLLDRAFTRLLSSVVDRLRSLEVIISLDRGPESRNWPLGSFLASLVDRPAPELRKLHILHWGYTPSGYWSTLDTGVVWNIFHVADGDTYHSATPSLRSLSLAPVWVSWQSQIFKDLSHLNLHVMYAPFPTMKQLLEVLRQSPALITCGLGFANLGDDAQQEPVIPLPLLSSLEIRIPWPSRISKLISHLALPPTTHFTIDTDAVVAHDGTPQFAVFPENREYLPALRELRSVEITVELMLRRVVFRLYSSITDAQEHLVATVSIDTVWLASIVRGMPTTMLDSATRLTYRRDSKGEFSEFDDWTATFRAARGLRVLRLVKPGNALVSALRDLTRVRDDAEPGGPARFCPELTELELDNVVLSDEAKASLIWFLTDRKDAGIPMKKVVFERASGLFPEYLVTLRELGVEVEERPSAG